MARLNSLLAKRRASGAMVEPASREPMPLGVGELGHDPSTPTGP